jgi:hypothetical protein
MKTTPAIIPPEMINAILLPEAISAIAKSLALEMHIADVEKPLYLVQNKAFRRYGRSNVENWITDGEVRMNDEGKVKYLRYEDLERCCIAHEYKHGVIQKRKYNKSTTK